MPAIRTRGTIDAMLGSRWTRLLRLAGIAGARLLFRKLDAKLVVAGRIAILGRPRRTSALSEVCKELAKTHALVMKVIVSMTDSVARFN